jgi:ferrous iron transport protein B
MGLSQDNWPATVGLLTGMLAKEVVVGSLNTLYAQSSEVVQHTAAVTFNFWDAIKEALWSVPENFMDLGKALFNPVVASAPDGEISQSVYGVMYRKFDGKVGAYAYLLFILLYVPCVSTMAVIRQEASRKMMWFSIIWSTLVAYAAAVLFYQTMRFSAHPKESILWVGLMVLLLGGFIAFLYVGTKSKRGGYVSTSP